MTYCAIHVPSNLLLHTGDYLHRQYTLMLHPGDYALLLHAGDYPTCSITYCSTLGTTPTSSMTYCSTLGSTPTCSITYCSTLGTTPTSSMTYCSMLGTTPTCSITYCSTLGTPPLQYDLLPPTGDHPHRRITYCSTLGTTPLQYDLLLRTGDYPHLPYNLLLTTWDYPYLPTVPCWGPPFLPLTPNGHLRPVSTTPFIFLYVDTRYLVLGVGQLTIHMCWRSWHFPRRATPWLLQSGQEFLHHPVFPLLANHHRRWGRAACRATLAHALRYAQLSSLNN